MAGGTVSVWLFYIAGVDRAIVTDALNDTILSNSRRWDAVYGKIYKSGFLYVSPYRGLVIAYFLTTLDHASPQRFLCPIATSGLFGK